MSDWQPNQYLKFERDRTQPAVDLAGRILVEAPKRILDVGCGPGNSTWVLHQRWPAAELTGLDTSPSMIERAREKHPEIQWILGDSAGDLSHLGSFDIIFSNAAFQWMPNHEQLIPKLFGMLEEGGVLAVQVPWVRELPVYAVILEIIARPEWKSFFDGPPQFPKHFPFAHYYDILCGLTQELNAWQTDYISIMDSHDGIVEWYMGTGLRPFLDMLPDEERKKQFTAAYREKIGQTYPVQRDGKVLLPFTRIFFTAYRTGNENA